jgi:hypothetical protein
MRASRGRPVAWGQIMAAEPNGGTVARPLSVHLSRLERLSREPALFGHLLTQTPGEDRTVPGSVTCRYARAGTHADVSYTVARGDELVGMEVGPPRLWGGFYSRPSPAVGRFQPIAQELGELVLRSPPRGLGSGLAARQGSPNCDGSSSFTGLGGRGFAAVFMLAEGSGLVPSCIRSTTTGTVSSPSRVGTSQR